MNQAREILARKQLVDQHIQALPSSEAALPQSSNGRGIAMTVGGTDMLLNALVVAKVTCKIALQIALCCSSIAQK